MSVKFETKKTTQKVFWVGFVSFAFIFGGFYTCIRLFFDNDFTFQESQYFTYSIYLVIYPLFFALILQRNAKASLLTITEFQKIDNFKEKLLTRVRKFSMTETKVNDLYTFLPTGFFKKLHNNWYETEKLIIEFKSDEVTVTGPMSKVSQIQDTLTWNKDFK
jgi:hypothetical protein